MRRENLNLYLDAFLGLSLDPQAARLRLIEQCFSAENVLDLLQEWLWIYPEGEETLLKAKVWFQLSYADLAQVFSLSKREVTQYIRNQRLKRMQPYRPAQMSEVGGLSCFMVEQHMSPWIDGELEDVRVLENVGLHLAQCASCAERLQGFRSVQEAVLKERGHLPEITEDEWEAAILHLKVERKRAFLKILFFGGLILVALVLLAWVIFSGSEKPPNVYEIP